MLMPRWNRTREDDEVPVTLSIKYVPDHVARRLRERAARNHRSLQGELLAIVQEAAIEGSGLSSGDEVAVVVGVGGDAR
jgi:plasmid stability protein